MKPKDLKTHPEAVIQQNSAANRPQQVQINSGPKHRPQAPSPNAFGARRPPAIRGR